MSSHNVELIFYCPHPDLTIRDAVVITDNPYSRSIAHLWNLAKVLEPSLADVYMCIFYIVRLSSLYTISGSPRTYLLAIRLAFRATRHLVLSQPRLAPAAPR